MFSSVKFLEAWDVMQTNGYDDLTEGPEEGWLGYYSLDKQGKMSGTSLKTLISDNSEAGLVWTDPEADPFICGHRGHASASCGFTFSDCMERVLAGGACNGEGSGPGHF